MGETEELELLMAKSNKEELERYVERERLLYETFRKAETVQFYGQDMVLVPASPENIEKAKEWARKTFGGETKTRRPYPCTVLRDRYNGIYSKGAWTAWNLLPQLIPKDPEGDDVTCAAFWGEWSGPVGKGRTPDEAVENLAEMPGVTLA